MLRSCPTSQNTIKSYNTATPWKWNTEKKKGTLCRILLKAIMVILPVVSFHLAAASKQPWRQCIAIFGSTNPNLVSTLSHHSIAVTLPPSPQSLSPAPNTKNDPHNTLLSIQFPYSECDISLAALTLHRLQSPIDCTTADSTLSIIPSALQHYNDIQLTVGKLSSA